MIVGLEFNDAFDLTAIGTLALAAVTLGSLAFAGRALKQTKEEIEVSRREVEEAHRPVVVPVADNRRMESAGHDVSPTPARPRFRPTAPGVPPGRMVVPIENIGTGPALHVEARAELLHHDGTRAGHGGEPASIGSVALGASTLGVTELATQRWDGPVPFGLTLTYADVAGSRWRTTARYLVDPREHRSEGRYEGLEIERVEPSASSNPSEHRRNKWATFWRTLREPIGPKRRES